MEMQEHNSRAQTSHVQINWYQAPRTGCRRTTVNLPSRGCSRNCAAM